MLRTLLIGLEMRAIAVAALSGAWQSVRDEGR